MQSDDRYSVWKPSPRAARALVFAGGNRHFGGHLLVEISREGACSVLVSSATHHGRWVGSIPSRLAARLVRDAIALLDAGLQPPPTGIHDAHPVLLGIHERGRQVRRAIADRRDPRLRPFLVLLRSLAAKVQAEGKSA